MDDETDMAIRVPRELVDRDPSVLAPAAGLTFLPDSEPGLARANSGGATAYTDPFGADVPSDVRERIDALAIPPSWSNVWISPAPDGYLQATGTDEAGRKQYRYHDRYRAFSDDLKFQRLSYFDRAVVLLRKQCAVELESAPGTKSYAIAAAVQLIDECLLRVGNHESASNGHYGATTLTIEHVVADGIVTLEYTAKSGQERHVVIDDDDLADVLTDLADGADNELFWFDDPETDERRRATATDINRFIAEHAGPAFSAKDFRTWGGSSAALAARALGESPVAATDAAAEELGNTRTVARSSYIHPSVLSAEQSDIDAVWSTSRASKWTTRAERALSKLLAERSRR